MTTRDDILKKGLEGKASTSTQAQGAEEKLASSIRPNRNVLPQGFILGNVGDMRFRGDLEQGSLFALSVPGSHPQRNRRLHQQILVHGLKTLAEGTNGSVLTTTTFDTDSIDLTTVAGLSDLRLVLTNHQDLGTINPDNLGVFRVASIAGSVITTTDLIPATITSGYYWALIQPNPSRMLPYLPVQGNIGEETSYLFTQPQVYPVFDRNKEIFLSDNSQVFSGPANFRDVGDVFLDGSHFYGGQIFSPGNIALLAGRYPCRVRTVSFTAGAPNSEILTLDPLWGIELDNYNDASASIEPMVLISDIFADLDAPITSLSTTIFNADQELDILRVKPLLRPIDGPLEVNTQSCQGFFVTDRASFRKELGYGIVLYPADGSGDPDLTNPLTDLENITIDPSITAEQFVLVDYEEGVLQLSHPIPVAGGDLNPNSFVDTDGRRRLFAMFVSTLDRPAPNASQSLIHRLQHTNTYAIAPDRKQGNSAATLAFEESPNGNLGKVSPISRGGSWVFRVPGTKADNIYHCNDADLTGASDSALGVSQAEYVVNTFEGNGPVIEMQSKSKNHGLHYLSMIARERMLPEDSKSQMVFVPNASLHNVVLSTETERFAANNQPDFRLVDGFRSTVTSVESGWAAITTGVNDTIHFAINNVEVTTTLPAGPLTAAALRAQLESDILAAGVAQSEFLVAGQEFTISLEGASGSESVRIEAKSYLFLKNGNGHANLGLLTNRQITSQNLDVLYGYDQEVKTRWSVNTGSLVTTTDMIDIRLDNSNNGGYPSSLANTAQGFDDNYPHYTLSGCTTTAGPGSDAVTVASGEVKHQNVANKQGNTISSVAGGVVDLAGQPTDFYYVYYDPVADALDFIGRSVGGFDPFFESSNIGVPLALVDFTNGLGVTAIYDYRRFGVNALDRGFITVGSRGMFQSLTAAAFYVQELVTNTSGTGQFTIRLTEDITLDGTTSPFGDVVYLPSQCTLDLAHYTIFCSQYNTGGINTGPFIFADPYTDAATSNIRIQNGRIDFDNFGTIGGGTAPTIFREGSTGAATDIIFEDIRFTGNEEVAALIDCAGTLRMTNVRSVGTPYDRVITTSQPTGRIVLDDCYISAQRTTVGSHGMFHVTGAFNAIHVRNSILLTTGDMPIIWSGTGDTTGMEIHITNTFMRATQSSLIGLVSNVAPNNARVYVTDSKMEFDTNFNLITDLSTSLEDLKLFVTNTIFDDLNPTGSNFLFLSNGCEASFSHSTLENTQFFVTAGTTTGPVFRFDQCVLNSTGTGNSSINLSTTSVPVMYLSNSTVIGNISAIDQSNTFITNSTISIPSGSASPALQLTGGRHRLANTQVTHAAGATATELVSVSNSGVGSQQQPILLFDNCNFAHTTVGIGLRINGGLDTGSVTGCRFDGTGGATGIQFDIQAGATDNNMQVNGGVMDGYGVSGSNSDAIVVTTNNNRIQFTNIVVLNATGATSFTITGGLTEVFTESTVRFFT